MKIPIKTVKYAVREMLGLKEQGSQELFDRRLKAVFALTLQTITDVWNRLSDSNLLPNQSKVHHLLCTLSFFKSYDTLDVYCCCYKTSKSTFWNRVKSFTYAIYQLKIVSKKPHK